MNFITGCEARLAALIESGDVPAMQIRLIAADIAELALPFATCRQDAPFMAMDAIRNARLLAAGKRDEKTFEGGVDGLFTCLEELSGVYSASGTRHALEAAVQACPIFGGRDEKESALYAYRQFVFAAICNEPLFMSEAEAADAMLSENPELEERVDFIILAHLGR